MLTQQELKALVSYDKDTGKFYWLKSSSRHAAGAEAGCIVVVCRGVKRSRVFLKGKQYSAERLAFLWTTGNFPQNMVDHINHDTLDNRFCNLRDVTNQVNQFNQVKPHQDSKSRYLGVSFFRRTGKYQARICIDKKQTHLGYFETAELAWEAYKLAKAKHHNIVL